MSESLVEWLSAQLDEDAKRAELAEGLGERQVVIYEDGRVDILAGETWADGSPYVPNRHQGWWLLPTKAEQLAEVAAKRRIIAEVVPSIDQMDTKIAEEWGGYCEGFGDQLLRLLALPYAGRDGWREEWRPE